MMIRKSLFDVYMFVFLAQMSFAQEWSVIANPSQRRGATMICDAENKRMVMFGGENYRLLWGGTHNDVWVLDLEPGNEAWQKLSPSGTPPSSRSRPSAIYDSSSYRMVLFGGRKDWTGYFNDVWVLTLEPGNERWEEIHTSGVSPLPRMSASAIYDGDGQKMIIFGGADSSQYFDDVWSLDLASFIWQSLTPTGTPPAPRHSATAIYDSLESCMIIFGGKDGKGLFNDLWALDLTIGNEAWSELFVSGDLPVEVAGHIAAYDCTTRRMYIFGGYFYPPFIYPEDVFYLDLNNLEWTRISLHPAPIGRRDLCGDFDYRNRRLIIYGGNRYYDYYFGDTYTFAVPPIRILEQEHPSPSSLFVTNAVPNPSSSSSTIFFHVPDVRHVTIRIYNVLGACVKTLLDEPIRPGWHSVKWDGKDGNGGAVGNGRYFFRIEAQDFTETRSVVVLK